MYTPSRRKKRWSLLTQGRMIVVRVVHVIYFHHKKSKNNQLCTAITTTFFASAPARAPNSVRCVIMWYAIGAFGVYRLACTQKCTLKQKVWRATTAAWWACVRESKNINNNTWYPAVSVGTWYQYKKVCTWYSVLNDTVSTKEGVY